VESIADMMRRYLGMRQAQEQPPAVPAPQPRPGITPIAGRVTYGRIPKLVAFTPEEREASMAWERGETNRAELERAMRAERRPQVQRLLRREHEQLFGGG
jgi:hypothetical protein